MTESRLFSCANNIMVALKHISRENKKISAHKKPLILHIEFTLLKRDLFDQLDLKTVRNRFRSTEKTFSSKEARKLSFTFSGALFDKKYFSQKITTRNNILRENFSIMSVNNLPIKLQRVIKLKGKVSQSSSETETILLCIIRACSIFAWN